MEMVVKALELKISSQIIIDISTIIINKYNIFNSLLNRAIYNYYKNDNFLINSKIMTRSAAKIKFVNYSNIRSGLYKSRF